VYEKEGHKTIGVCPVCGGRKYVKTKVQFEEILNQSVRTFARRTLFFVDASESITTATNIMKEKGVESIFVKEHERPVGVLTIKDIIFKVVSKGLNPSEVLVSSVMSSPVITIGVDDTMKNAFDIMERNNLRRILVLESDGKPYGLLVLEHLVGDLIKKGN
jgi:predicted transcriptional regulator